MSGPFGSSQFMYATGALAEGSSLRFEDGDSAYLSWTPASAGNRTTWTWSGWVKRSNLTSFSILFGAGTGTILDTNWIGFSSDTLFYSVNDGTYAVSTSAVFRDPSAWYHVVLSVDTTQATASDRIKLYVNGVQQTSLSRSDYPPQNDNSEINSAILHVLGARYRTSIDGHYDGYLANVAFIDGQALDPTSFGEYQDTLWKPKSDTDIQALTFGTNGFYLAFEDSSAIGDDTSGNTNDWTANNLLATDVVPDSPVTNFAVLDILGSGAGTWSEGNLKYVSTADTSTSTFGLSSGAFYAEVLVSANNNSFIGVCDISKGLNPNRAGSWSSHGGIAYKANGDQYSLAVGGSSSTAAYGSSYTAGDIIGIAVDIDADTITFYKNGVSQGTTTNGVSYISSDGIYGILVYGTSSTFIANFGQDSSFAGTKTPQGNTDDNGVGDFYYAPPSGFLALTTGNLPTPDITAPDEYFNTVLYSGDGTSSRSITAVNFQPDWVWIKIRNGLSGNNVFDSVRGATKRLYTNGTAAEDTLSGVTSFDTDGFTLGSALNGSGESNVAWNWLAGGTAVSNTDGSITSQVSANQTAGFSVVSHTGNGSNATIGHGLGVAPSMILYKRRDSTGDWNVYHASLGKDTNIILNTTGASYSSTTWNNTAPTSSVYSIVAGANTNTATYIAYCFAEVESYSKCGVYTGNGSTDGTFVHCGFRPAWVMIKRTNSSGNWRMYDNERVGYNVVDDSLQANLSNSEDSNNSFNSVDFVSNGFKLRGNAGGDTNDSADYIFIAFAEAPFKNANAR